MGRFWAQSVVDLTVAFHSLRQAVQQLESRIESCVCSETTDCTGATAFSHLVGDLHPGALSERICPVCSHHHTACCHAQVTSTPHSACATAPAARSLP